MLKLPSRRYKTLLTKNPRDHFTVPHLLELDEELYFIFMLRDPRDVLVSKHGHAPDRYWGNMRLWRAAWKSIATVKEHPRLKIVRYEDLVGDPDGVQRKLAEFLPFLEMTGKFSDFHTRSKPTTQSLIAMGPLRPVTPESVGNWRSHKPRIVGQIQRHGSLVPDLIESGYETDDSWLAELEGIQPDLSPGFWPDERTDNLLKQLRRDFDVNLPAYLKKRGLEC